MAALPVIKVTSIRVFHRLSLNEAGEGFYSFQIASVHSLVSVRYKINCLDFFFFVLHHYKGVTYCTAVLSSRVSHGSSYTSEEKERRLEKI